MSYLPSTVIFHYNTAIEMMTDLVEHHLVDSDMMGQMIEKSMIESDTVLHEEMWLHLLNMMNAEKEKRKERDHLVYS